MKIMRYTDVDAEAVGGEAKSASVRWLIAEKDNAPNFYMRVFELGPGGATPHHRHDWEHEIFILEGAGRLVGENSEYTLSPGMFAFVEGGEIHHLENAGDDTFVFICLVPKT